jgi:hypothetical protein
MDRNQVLQTDTEFNTSPDAGHPDCICSRCGLKIGHRELPLRIFTGKKRNTEFRYCRECASKDFKIDTGLSEDSFPDDDDDDFFDDY